MTGVKQLVGNDFSYLRVKKPDLIWEYYSESELMLAMNDFNRPLCIVPNYV